MWLQVSRLSEITLADGCRLHPDPLNGRLPHGHDEINLKWPRQDRPPPQWWSLWRQCLCRSFSIDGKDTKLRQPLVEWHASALSTTSFTTHAAFVLTGTTNTLYQQVPGSSTFDTFPSQDNVIHRRLTRANMFAPLSNGRVGHSSSRSNTSPVHNTSTASDQFYAWISSPRTPLCSANQRARAPSR